MRLFRSLQCSLFCALAALALGSPALGQCETQFLRPAEPHTGLEFAGVVAIDGTTAVVGLPNDGRVEVYDRQNGTWTPFATLTAPGFRFGEVLAVSGDVIAVGVPYDSSGGADAGAVFVYRRAGSVYFPEVKLYPENVADGDNFGWALGLVGDLLVVGSPGHDAIGYNSGSIYVYRYDGTSWIMEAQFEANGREPFYYLGINIAFDGTTIVAQQSIETYLFRHNGTQWEQISTLPISWHPIAISGSTLVVGFPQRAGLVVVYEESGGTWSDVAAFYGLDWGWRLGAAVDVWGDWIIAGAPDAWSEGRVAFFHRGDTGWEEEGYLGASDLWGDDPGLGSAVAISGDVAIAGAPLNEVGGALEVGTAHTFTVDTDHCSCLAGQVNLGAASLVLRRQVPVDHRLGAGGITKVLFVNGSSGGMDRTVSVSAGDTVLAYLLAAPAGGNGKYVVHGDVGRPSSDTVDVLPASIGTTCFPFLLSDGAAPVIVANNIGKSDHVGASEYFGTSTADPPRAPSIFLELHGGDIANLPPGTSITFQGVLIDPASPSPKSVSTTNSVVLSVE